MAYTSDSPADRLAAVRQSIADCLKAQAYGMSGRSKTAPRLSELRQAEKELMEEVGNSGSMCSLGIQVEPSE